MKVLLVFVFHAHGSDVCHFGRFVFYFFFLVVLEKGGILGKLGCGWMVAVFLLL